ncbi:hypothetical protein N3K66_008188 [Trichothecium roseum]|uniref:Uncharacterized protein n=1 Tax=Trichothecium roseum TaxID=47278 RepID=A0ACC0UU36_9HYPO|nr:hypothetical protein N3K66_008188 [Trichothecium roseum]
MALERHIINVRKCPVDPCKGYLIKLQSYQHCWDFTVDDDDELCGYISQYYHRAKLVDPEAAEGFRGHPLGRDLDHGGHETDGEGEGKQKGKGNKKVKGEGEGEGEGSVKLTRARVAMLYVMYAEEQRCAALLKPFITGAVPFGPASPPVWGYPHPSIVEHMPIDAVTAPQPDCCSPGKYKPGRKKRLAAPNHHSPKGLAAAIAGFLPAHMTCTHAFAQLFNRVVENQRDNRAAVAREHNELVHAHADLCRMYKELSGAHVELMEAHQRLMRQTSPSCRPLTPPTRDQEDEDRSVASTIASEDGDCQYSWGRTLLD